MIAGLDGLLDSVGVDHAIIDVGGVLYRVNMPASSLSSLGKGGDRVRVHTHMYVREDQIALYGMTDERQLRMFESLLTVSGIGPKVALSILSTMPVDSLESAIASGNVDLLTRVPGIGRKTATRLVLELKGRLDLLVAAGVGVSPTTASEVIEALSGLGYTPAEIQAALSALPKDNELSTEDMMLFALKRLGR